MQELIRKNPRDLLSDTQPPTWRAEDYVKDERASAIRDLCLDAVRTLINFQKSEINQRDVFETPLNSLRERFMTLGIAPGMRSDKEGFYTTKSALAMAECRAADLAHYFGTAPKDTLNDFSLNNEPKGKLIDIVAKNLEPAVIFAQKMCLFADTFDAVKQIFEA